MIVSSVGRRSYQKLELSIYDKHLNDFLIEVKAKNLIKSNKSIENNSLHASYYHYKGNICLRL